MKIAVAILQTIDGYIARSNSDDLAWASKEDRRFFVEKTMEIGTMIMGSTTFNAMKMVKGTAFKGRRCLVLTSKPEDYANYKNEFTKVEFFKGSATEAAEYLEDQGVNQAIVIGGGKLIQQFLEAGLINEIFVTIAPEIFGNGIKVCDGLIPDQKLELIDSKMISESEILLHYTITQPV